MTAQELLDALKASGTGETKLAVGHGLIEADTELDAQGLVDGMEKAGVNPITLGKARALLPQEPPKEKPRAKAKWKQSEAADSGEKLAE